jgi:hypothetical protein
MKELHQLSLADRQLFLDEAQTITGVPFSILEKDFWVVWTLERLFSLDDLKSHLTFKGGTSLAKVYRIIERFSEDIDVSIEQNFLGFDKEKDPEKAVSKKKQKAALDALASSCAKYIQGKLLNDLKESIAERMGTTEGWQLVIDEKDPDGQTLQFEYPNITPRGDYIQQSVKIEMGARSEHWPVSNHKIQSYVKEALNEKVAEAAVAIRVLNAERTFWEKATILHQYAHIPTEKKLLSRISRHLYDFYCLLNSPIKQKALGDLALLERVAIHKSIYFASAWANYNSAKKGTLKLCPPERIVEALETDFESMKAMFFGEIPEWNLILKTIKEFETEFNR